MSDETLCKMCRDGIRLALGTYREAGLPQLLQSRIGHGYDWNAFKHAVKSGCYICCHLYIRLTDKLPLEKKNKEEESAGASIHRLSMIDEVFCAMRHSHTFDWLEDDRLRLRVTFYPAQAEDPHLIYRKGRLEHLLNHECTLDFFFLAAREGLDDLRKDIPLTGISNTGDAASWTTVKTWVEDCLANHPECSRSKSRMLPPPRRLLHVGTSPEAIVKIVDTVTLQDVRRPYVTLSYCWGSNMPLRLLKANAQDFHRDLPMGELPRTFAEAIEVTRRLGVQYLWIDALCIVQDDAEDWREQASIMADIYSGSMVTIAAQASRSAAEGLFRERLNIHSKPAVIEVSLPSGTRVSYAVYSEHAFEDSCCGPLSSRAWVFQEHVFAQRRLVFGENSVFWECNSSEAASRSENCPAGIPSSFACLSQTSSDARIISSLRGCVKLDVESLGADTMLETWRAAIKIYSQCNLTFEQDRLVAVSALAKSIPGLREIEYVAGLWKKWLPYELCWAAESPGRRTFQYVAPSWSWASLNGPLKPTTWTEITLNDASDGDWSGREEVKIIDHEVSPAGKDTTGQLVGGWLFLTGTLLPVSIQALDLLTLGGVSDGVDDKGSDARRDKSHRFDVRHDVSVLIDEKYKMWIWWDEKDGHDKRDKIVYLLPLISAAAGNRIWDRVHGLVIESDLDPDGTEFYRRMGMFTFFNRMDYWEILRKTCLDADRRLQEKLGVLKEYAPVQWEKWHEYKERYKKAQPIMLM